MRPLRTALHLAKRFFGVLASKPLGPGDQDYVNGVLPRDQAALFWELDAIDQRHCFEVAMRVRSVLGDDAGAIRAALMHDIGKRHSRLGPVSRSLATVFDVVGFRLPAEWRKYRDHGELGAADLEIVGADELSVSFARGHRSGREGTDEVWEALVAADNV